MKPLRDPDTPRREASIRNGRHERCLATLRSALVDRAAVYIPAISCAVSSKILGREAVTGTGSLHYAEVAAWADGETAHAEFESPSSL